MLDTQGATKKSQYTLYSSWKYSLRKTKEEQVVILSEAKTQFQVPLQIRTIPALHPAQ